MKVLQIIDNLYTGGAERVMVNMCNWLDQAGVDVVPVLIDGRGTDLFSEIRTRTEPVILKRKGKFDFHAASQLAALMKEANIAHVHMRHNFRYVQLICKLWRVSIPLILHDHSSTQSLLFGLNHVFRPGVYIGVNSKLAKWAKRKMHLQNSLVFLLYNTVDVDIVDKKMSHKEKIDLVLVSNIKKHKNQLFGLNVAAAGGYKIDFIGQIQEEDYFKLIVSEVQRRKIEKQVRFLHDITNVQRLLGGYRLGIHTSISETGPLTIIEYLAQGLPFVAYRTGEAAEKIAEELPEFFLDTFEVDAWLDRIRHLLESPPDKEKMRAVFEKHFSKENYVSKCLNIYHDILGC